MTEEEMRERIKQSKLIIFARIKEELEKLHGTQMSDSYDDALNDVDEAIERIEREV